MCSAQPGRHLSAVHAVGYCVQALLSGVPQGRLVLLDLFAEEHPIWTRTSALYGHPFIWCMLHNFGGNSAMYGALPAVAEGVSSAMRTAPENLVGIGMAPEGIEQNPALYEFMAGKAISSGVSLLLDRHEGLHGYLILANVAATDCLCHAACIML